MMTGEPTSFLPPSQEIPVWGGMFADDSELGPPLPGAKPPETDTGDDQPGEAEPSDPPPPPESQRRSAETAP